MLKLIGYPNNQKLRKKNNYENRQPGEVHGQYNQGGQRSRNFGAHEGQSNSSDYASTSTNNFFGGHTI